MKHHGGWLTSWCILGASASANYRNSDIDIQRISEKTTRGDNLQFYLAICMIMNVFRNSYHNTFHNFSWFNIQWNILTKHKDVLSIVYIISQEWYDADS